MSTPTALPTIEVDAATLARAIAAAGAPLDVAQRHAVNATGDLAEARRQIAQGAPPELIELWLRSRSE